MQPNSNWMTEHMHGVLLTIEIFWVGGVLAIFVFYFAVKRRVKEKRRRQAAQASAGSTSRDETSDSQQPPK